MRIFIPDINVRHRHLRHRKSLVVVILAVMAVFLLAVYFFMPRQDANNPLARYDEAMRADREGGKTPEETLRLFVSALRADDPAQASSYFTFDAALSRKKWLERLTKLKEQGLFGMMADDIEMHARRARAAYDHDAQFEIMNSDGTIGALIDMEFNALSGVWKLERF